MYISEFELKNCCEKYQYLVVVEVRLCQICGEDFGCKPRSCEKSDRLFTDMSAKLRYGLGGEDVIME